jgi:hypothetical protein
VRVCVCVCMCVCVCVHVCVCVCVCVEASQSRQQLVSELSEACTHLCDTLESERSVKKCESFVEGTSDSR